MIYLIFTLAFSSNIKIMKDVVKSFAKQCNYIGSIESNIVRKLEQNYKQAQQDLADEALGCYRESITEISSTNYIYQNLCDEINKTNIKLDMQTLMRLFVSSQKYRKGIKIEHSVLNDCLKNKDNTNKYIVDLNFNRIETKYLKQRLLEIKPHENFRSNRTSLR